MPTAKTLAKRDPFDWQVVVTCKREGCKKEFLKVRKRHTFCSMLCRVKHHQVYHPRYYGKLTIDPKTGRRCILVLL